MGLEHYIPQLEFYYQNPRPKKLSQILRQLDKNGVLNYADNRLMIAAFLSELARKGKVDLKSLAPANAKINLRHTLLWSARLAGEKAYSLLSPALITDRDKTLASQLEHVPYSLRDWRLEPAVVRMYVAAFMASGDEIWIEALIDAALLQNSSVAAASRAILFDSASRHRPIRERLEKRANSAAGDEKEILTLILSGTKNPNKAGNPRIAPF